MVNSQLMAYDTINEAKLQKLPEKHQFQEIIIRNYCLRLKTRKVKKYKVLKKYQIRSARALKTTRVGRTRAMQVEEMYLPGNCSRTNTI